MNPAEWTAFITSITALITAIYGVIVLIMHVRTEHVIPPKTPPDPAGKPSLINPQRPGTL